MTNEIAHPLVEGGDEDEAFKLVSVDATVDGVVTITMNRPERRNALNAQLIEAMIAVLETVDNQDGIRIVFLRGAGGTFSAGADLEWMKRAADYTESENREDAFQMARMLKAIWDMPCLTVALIEGGAFGGGGGIAAACDMAIATQASKFSFSEVRLGLIPGTISPYVVSAVGPRNARALFATGRVFDADYAERIGLVSEVVADAAGLDAAQARLATEIMACGPEAVADAKDLVTDVAWRKIDHHLMDETAHRIARARAREEGQEGVRAFLEKRKAAWTSPE
jgi:methylglutaconyl-CoA hydratase